MGLFITEDNTGRVSSIEFILLKTKEISNTLESSIKLEFIHSLFSYIVDHSVLQVLSSSQWPGQPLFSESQSHLREVIAKKILELEQKFPEECFYQRYYVPLFGENGKE
jgi:hypothetical protein